MAPNVSRQAKFLKSAPSMSLVRRAREDGGRIAPARDRYSAVRCLVLPRSGVLERCESRQLANFGLPPSEDQRIDR